MKYSRLSFFFGCCLIAAPLLSAAQAVFISEIQPLKNEKWWGGFVGIGSKMPFAANTEIFNLSTQNYNNQIVPLLLSSEGRYVWCEHPFRFQMRNDTLAIYSDYEKATAITAGKTLREAYLAASAAHFPPTGTIPAEAFFSKPQYNTWIELMYNQNQDDILNYAHKAIENGFPAGSQSVAGCQCNGFPAALQR
jgi:alpha-glucosidase